MGYEINYYQAGMHDYTEIESTEEDAEDKLIKDGFKLQNDGSWYDKERCMWAYIEPLVW